VDFELSDEQKALREAARDALTRTNLIEAAHEMLDGKDGPDLWPTAREAGWTGLLISEEHGGAGLGALDAMLVFAECGRVLAGIPLLGHVAATAILDPAAEAVGADRLTAIADGAQRVAYVGAAPPSDVEDGWTVDALSGMRRLPAPVVAVSGDQAAVTGEVAWVPDAPGADALVVVATSPEGPVAVLIDADARGVGVEAVQRYDATRSLGHVSLEGATGTVLAMDEAVLTGTWYLAQGLIGAESLGSVERSLEMAVEYAKERHTFGRAIGSYQAIKHGLVEVLRMLENARSLMYYAGWARQDAPAEFAVAACALRTAGGNGLDYASRELISVHGGIGATWEHDAPLFFRRAQLSRRLLGGTGDATDRVAGELLAAASAAA
jgi:alkylation response protein AidB-like acyl-CoA dehydrogenase